METTFTVPGPIPSKKNSKQWIVRGGRKYLVPSDRHAAWYVQAKAAIKVQSVPRFGEVSAVAISFLPSDRRRHDLSNCAESVMDLLVDMGILIDDSWWEVPALHLDRAELADIPGAEVTIKGRINIEE